MAAVSLTTVPVGALVLFLLWKVLAPRRGRHLPPGPPRLPFIGNAHQFPNEKPWLAYHEWSKTYGSMVYVEALGQPVLVLHDIDACNDLLDRRSSVYSSRPRMPMLRELMGWDWIFTFQPYGDSWRRQRKLFHQWFNSSQVHHFIPIQKREWRRMLVRLLHTPENFLHHIRHTLAASIMDVSYGIPVEASDDKYILKAEQAMNTFSIAVTPGTFLVDFFPFLAYLPAWLPFADFKRKAMLWRDYNRDMMTWPFEAVKKAMSDGTANPSIARTLIEKFPPEGPEREDAETLAKRVAGEVYAGGADTTVSAAQSFFMAMACFPEVQRRAQAEIDRVVGSDRIPEYGDKESMPYLQAICKEILRWQPVTPVGAAHYLTVDDEYRGYFIPKGTIVLGNIWSMTHNPDYYEDPFEFRPERFLNEKGELDEAVRDPGTIAFGFGRRNCPGKWYAAQALFTEVSSVLAVYDILPPLDENGKSVPVEPLMSDGGLSHPVPFKCRIIPRSEKAKGLVLDIENHE